MRTKDVEALIQSAEEEAKGDDAPQEKQPITYDLVKGIWPYVIQDENIPSESRVNNEGYEICLELR